MPDRRATSPLLLSAACLAALLSLPVAAAESAPGRRATAAVTDRIAANDCTAAVDELNAALKQGYTEVILLAGSMFDHGVCVKRNWNRAVSFYSQAYEGGMPEAASRLAAGFAAPENGPDVAAALWWASRGRGQAAQVQANAGCAVSAAAADDAERFVAELQTWPQARLLACNYIAGVMSTLSAEIKYPQLALRYAVGGDVTLRFQPAVPQIDMRRGESREYQLIGIFRGEQLHDRQTERVTGGFEKALGEVADRALRRYPKPAGIPAETRVLVQYRFVIDSGG